MMWKCMLNFKKGERTFAHTKHNTYISASATLEGALVIPLFIYACFAIAFLLWIDGIRTNVNQALYESVRLFVRYGYASEAIEEKLSSSDIATLTQKIGDDSSSAAGSILSKGLDIAAFEVVFLDKIGTDYAENNYIVGGNAGWIFLESKITQEDDLIDIKLTYVIKNPFDIFGIGYITVNEEKTSAVWLGEDSDAYKKLKDSQESTDATEETTSNTEETTDATEETVSSTEETTDATEETKSSTEETTDGTEETVSSTEETKHSTEETTSSTESSTESSTDSTEDSTKDDKTYYMSTYGTVYHVDRNCTYLTRVIESCSLTAIANVRNASGAKYYQCRICKSTKSDTVYYTQYGTSYHTKYNCSELQRVIRTVSKDEVEGISACKKCSEGSDD